MRREEHGYFSLLKQSGRQEVNSIRHSFRPMVGLEQAGHNQVREEGPGQEKNVNQSHCQEANDLQLQKDVDIQRGVGVREPRDFPRRRRLYP